MKTIDTTGLSCPQPVLMTMKEINFGETKIKVIVDNNTSMENVRRLAESKNFVVEIQEGKDDLIMLFLTK